MAPFSRSPKKLAGGSEIGFVTSSVSCVSGHPKKFKLGVSDTPKKLKGIPDLLASKGNSHFQAAVSTLKMREIS